ncbi:hypothetical protein [Pseudomonas chlororaphis]|uniref:hypothetical protein n=1 Tax=Pseudomonas chlororaphis TaxID=587753 RepID=UPI0015DDEC18|nr:hypothetical protein [Pseudomonas chlororaphis]QLL11840.1 hypothetical protein H0I86_22855 [Pseudomonas chlororaphis subsp. aurantiaca]
MITILLVSIASYCLKILPLLSRKLILAPSGLTAKTVEYAVCFIMGGIIVNVAFGNATFAQLTQTLETKNVLSAIAIAAAFVTSRYTGSILKSLLLSMILYITTMVMFHEDYPHF